jgi:hypothetical protein
MVRAYATGRISTAGGRSRFTAIDWWQEKAREDTRARRFECVGGYDFEEFIFVP